MYYLGNIHVLRNRVLVVFCGGGVDGVGVAPVTSQSAEMELMLEIRCARKALAVSFESSALHRFVVSTWASGTHLVAG